MAFVAYLLENAILLLFDLGSFNTFIVAPTGRKNGFAAKLLSANLMQKRANQGVNLCKGGKYHICIHISTPGCKQVCKMWHLSPLHRFIPQFALLCIKFGVSPFFRPLIEKSVENENELNPCCQSIKLIFMFSGYLPKSVH